MEKVRFETVTLEQLKLEQTGIHCLTDVDTTSWERGVGWTSGGRRDANAAVSTGGRPVNCGTDRSPTVHKSMLVFSLLEESMVS